MFTCTLYGGALLALMASVANKHHDSFTYNHCILYQFLPEKQSSEYENFLGNTPVAKKSPDGYSLREKKVNLHTNRY